MRKQYRKPAPILILPPGWSDVTPPVSPETQCAYRHRYMLVLVGDELVDGKWWRHWSASQPASTPSYEDLLRIKQDLIGPRHRAYQLFVPEDEHINYDSRVLHLWQPLDRNPLPDFREEPEPGVFVV